ncbi:MAG TPA: methyltransferase domain-containing protein [Firmicutes bacterium]|nr:methyltransferase domain-containing protein [Bacillota bacterium]
MRPYSALARYYSKFTENVEYKKRTDYILELMRRHGCNEPQLLLDLACGAGGFSLELAERGVDVIGVDISEEMLAAAQTEMYSRGLHTMFIKQDMRELDLYGTVDTAICMLDSLNHITDIGGLKRTIERVSLFLEPGGIFIFDVNTLYKHREVLSGSCYVYECDGAVCVWSNSECSSDGTVNISLDIFEETANGLYSRSTENFSERAYDVTAFQEILADSGFKVCGIYGDMSFDKPCAVEERMYFVAERLSQ